MTFSIFTPPGVCSVGVISSKDIFTCAGLSIANKIDSAMSVGVNIFNPFFIFIASFLLSKAISKNSVSTLPGFISVHLTPVPVSSSQNDASKRAPRRDVEMSLSFEIALDSGSEHNFYTGLTNNISEGGVFIATTQILDIGTKIKFPLALPSMLEPEQVEGVVKWVRREGRSEANVPGGIGIQFTQISEKLKARINEYIQSSDTIFYDD